MIGNDFGHSYYQCIIGVIIQHLLICISILTVNYHYYHHHQLYKLQCCLQEPFNSASDSHPCCVTANAAMPSSIQVREEISVSAVTGSALPPSWDCGHANHLLAFGVKLRCIARAKAATTNVSDNVSCLQNRHVEQNMPLYQSV